MSAPVPYNTGQRAEEAIQYYRASSVVLTLDGYNNTAALGSDESMPSVAFPSDLDFKVLACINQTIGTAVPLVGNYTPASLHIPSTFFLVLLAWAVWGSGNL